VTYKYDALDDFAGAGGWDEGARLLGLTFLGIDNDDTACATAEHAGHARFRFDVQDFPGATGVPGYVASPPCTDFSPAGLGRGEDGPTGHLVHWPARRIAEMRPEWVALEQVPRVLPIWQALARQLRADGWSVWTGVLDTADYGVPQNRLRAILIGSRVRRVGPPTPTHSEDPDNLLGLPAHVTLADVLGIGPGWEYDSGQNSQLAGGQLARYVRSCDRPAGTLTTKAASQWNLRRGDERRRLSIDEAAALQTFRAGYPWKGRREDQLRQIGNAVPPLFAAHVIAAAAGVPVPADLCGALA
jgi:DNA (cytosine-5)-methyltransferase 1